MREIASRSTFASTGEVTTDKLFVAVRGASNLTFVTAVLGEDVKSRAFGSARAANNSPRNLFFEKRHISPTVFGGWGESPAGCGNTPVGWS
jgi:hypothetical protein